MHFKYLSDVHTRRNAERVEYDIKRSAVGKERHVFLRKNSGNDTLVTVTTCHFIADRNLALLSNVTTDNFVNTCRKLGAVFACKYFDINDDSVFAVWNTKGGVTNFSCFFAENSTE